MRDNETGGLVEAAGTYLDEKVMEATSGREEWCNEELALEHPEEKETEDKASTAENGYQSTPGADPDLWIYRDRTIGILRRYLRLAVEVGRLPALLGREFFRTRVTSYHTQTFEDTVIFVHDVECCVNLLNDAEIELIAVIVTQGYLHYEAAEILHCTRRTIVRSYGEALDRLSEIFLNREILRRLPEKNTPSTEVCQEGKTRQFSASG
ncbi:MAG: hypothetical protein WAL32_07280 [Terriglobales bacterium]